MCHKIRRVASTRNCLTIKAIRRSGWPYLVFSTNDVHAHANLPIFTLQKYRRQICMRDPVSDHKSSALLVTGTEFDPAEVVAELKTIPQILSTHTEGVPVWVVGLLLFVAHGIVIQSVEQVVPTLLPSAGDPPVILKDMAGVFTEKMNHYCYS